MRLKSFQAKTVSEAMHMIREALGEDAIIVATEDDPGGKGVCVTAAVDQDVHQVDVFDEFDREADEESGWLQYDREAAGDVSEALTEALLKHAVPEEIIDQVVSCATIVGLEQAFIALVAALEHLFVFRPLPLSMPDKSFMLIGPPGAGKTLAISKLAARGVLAGKRVSVISTDTLRAGGIEQLAAFTRILDIPLQKARDGRELQGLIDAARGADLILIDSGGFNPFNAAEMRDLARLIAVADIEPVLTLPAGIDSEECGEMARIYAALGVNNLLPTRLDISRRMGGLLSAAHYGGLIFSDASDTPQVADGLQPLSPQHLAKLLMPQTTPAREQGERPQEATTHKHPVNAG